MYLMQNELKCEATVICFIHIYIKHGINNAILYIICRFWLFSASVPWWTAACASNKIFILFFSSLSFHCIFTLYVKTGTPLTPIHIQKQKKISLLRPLWREHKKHLISIFISSLLLLPKKKIISSTMYLAEVATFFNCHQKKQKND